MANIKSAKKRILITRKQTAINKAKKTEIKTYIKKFNKAIDAGNIDEAKELLKVIDRKLKRASHANLIHKNAVARKVSKLTKQINQAV